MPIDLSQPFRGSDAVAAGLVTPKVLRGPRFRRLFTGIYIRADVEVTFEVRSRAAYLLLDGSGVLGGSSAAELLGASCGTARRPCRGRRRLRRRADPARAARAARRARAR